MGKIYEFLCRILGIILYGDFKGDYIKNIYWGFCFSNFKMIFCKIVL